MRASLSVLFGFLIVLAGCTQGAPATDVDVQPTSSSPAADPSLATGALAGLVTDDTQLPLAGVHVAILETDFAAITDEVGRFQLQGLPIGKHTVTANKAGYESGATKVEVLADEEASVTFLLVAVVVAEPFVEVFPHSSQHVVGSLLIDTVSSTYGAGTCDACRWTQKTTGPSMSLVIEITGIHNIPKPTGPPIEYIEIQKNNPFVLIASGMHPLPAKIVLSSEAINDTEDFLFYALCDPDWVCLDERRDFWISAFHHQAAPEDYSALPKG